MKKTIILFLAFIITQAAVLRCGISQAARSGDCKSLVHPKLVTDMTPYDTDDPAIWIHPSDTRKSLVLGTDKNKDGGLYAFDMKGHIIKEKTVRPLKRPNNVDVEYGLKLAGNVVDIAVVTERLTHCLRVFSLPDMYPLDDGGLEVFKGETGEDHRALMGISLYKRPEDGQVFAIVGRKNGQSGSYLWQYLLHDDGMGKLKATLVRKFGTFSGNNEIEAIAVDDELGYVYYSDEGVGVRKYYADPANGDMELALFAQEGFTEDHEGISIYKAAGRKGYILVSDQAANKFHIFPREGSANNPHDHQLLSVVELATNESDGSEVVSVPIGKSFPLGLFVAMSDNRTFQYYSWIDIAKKAFPDLPVLKAEFDVSQVDTIPQIINRTEPVYPYRARQKKINGIVVVKFLVTKDGRVEQASVVQSNPSGVFDEAALLAVSSWRFRPGMLENEPVATWISMPISFEM